jgi:hypothetical protein
MMSIDGNLRYPPREEEQQKKDRRNVSEEHFHCGILSKQPATEKWERWIYSDAFAAGLERPGSSFSR